MAGGGSASTSREEREEARPLPALVPVDRPSAEENGESRELNVGRQVSQGRSIVRTTGQRPYQTISGSCCYHAPDASVQGPEMAPAVYCIVVLARRRAKEAASGKLSGVALPFSGVLGSSSPMKLRPRAT